MTRAYYNEVDPHAAQWLRNLIAAKLITAGEVDTRSILDVRPGDLAGFERCHFFAGIGVWDHALRLAGWPADRPVWTGSCPCQPFSAAGGRGGFADERHLWPAFFHLIRECRPATVLGEQVASKDGLGWLDLVQADLEGEGYAVGAADLCAPGESVDGEGCPDDQWLQRAILDCPDSVLAGELRAYADWARGSISLGAPNIRQRLWFVAHADGGHAGTEWKQRGGEHGQQPEDGVARIMANPAGQRRDGSKLAGAAGAATERGAETSGRRASRLREPTRHGAALILADTSHVGRREVRADLGGLAAGDRSEGRPSGSLPGRALGFVGDTGSARSGRYAGAVPGAQGEGQGERSRVGRQSDEPLPSSAAGEFWSAADWLPCRDGKARPVESGSFPLVDGSAFRLGSGSAYEGRSRAGMLKGYGNAINAQRARGFIEAVMECRPTVEGTRSTTSLMAAE